VHSAFNKSFRQLQAAHIRILIYCNTIIIIDDVSMNVTCEGCGFFRRLEINFNGSMGNPRPLASLISLYQFSDETQYQSCVIVVCASKSPSALITTTAVRRRLSEQIPCDNINNNNKQQLAYVHC
jgi:hypothetical protein